MISESPLLADRPRPVAEPLVHLPVRPGAPFWSPCCQRACGERELPAGAGGGHWPAPGPRAAGRGHALHDRRHRRRSGVQHGADPRHRHGQRRAGAYLACCNGRAGGPIAPAPKPAPKRCAYSAVAGGRNGLAYGSPERDASRGSRLTAARRQAGSQGRLVSSSSSWRTGQPGCLLHLRRRGDERLGCRHPDEESGWSFHSRRQGPGIDPARRHAGVGMLGHIPALVHKKPESVLVVAWVARASPPARSSCTRTSSHRRLRHRAAGADHRHADVRQRRTTTWVDGIAGENPHSGYRQAGRGGLPTTAGTTSATTQEKFDILIVRPDRPTWVKEACAAPNTVEYYQMCRDRLKPGGIVCHWTHLSTGPASTRSKA